MKKMEYIAPEMETIEFKCRANVLLEASPGTESTGGLSDEISTENPE